jgi:putative membrane protein
MIIRAKPSILQLFFVMRGSIVPNIILQILFVTVLSVVLVVEDHYFVTIPAIPLQVFWVFGVALSLFLGFRNNAAYIRWWEARTLWGQLIGDVRCLSRESLVFLGECNARNDVLVLASASMHLHRSDLRDVNVDKEILQWLNSAELSALKKSKNPASSALDSIARILHSSHAQGQCSDMGLRVLTERLAAMTQAQAGAERISNTPLPFVYSLLVKRTAYLYCLLIPLGLTAAAGWLAPVFSAIIAYAFFGLDAVTDQLESPFKAGPNSLALNAMCNGIDATIADAIGKEAPAAIIPAGYVLD